MKIKSIKIHNFRSIKDAEFDLDNYNVLVGANNSGKTSTLTALRILYEDIKFDENRDFPKFETEDHESWIEIKYLLTDYEFKNLKEEYKNPNNTLIVRKYFKSKERVKSNQGTIYAYENGELSTNLFYGAKNISQAKLGSLIYIPDVTKTEETLKLTGPSPLRDILNFVIEKVIGTSESFKSLNDAFEEFNSGFREEESKDGFSLENFRKKINENLKEWNVEFKLDINPVQPKDIIKNLISYRYTDKVLNKDMDVKLYGQGLQRHLIYTLIRLSVQYTEEKVYEKKGFSPEFTLILFEEPEAFLHPTQQEYLNSSLRSLSSEEGQQVIVSTHSPIFVCRNIEEISSIIRLKKDDGVTKCFQVSEEIRKDMLRENNELVRLLKEKLDDPSVNKSTESRIKKLLGDTDDEMRMEEDAIRYSLWIDFERCSSFFANIVLICEGATEKTFIDYLIKNEWEDLREKRIYVLDAMGKFNIHRYMNLFKELGIHHSILADKDKNNGVHEIINEFIMQNKNKYTKNIHFFEEDIEEFLGIQRLSSRRKDKKPLNVMWHYKNDKIQPDKINNLKILIEKLI